MGLDCTCHIPIHRIFSTVLGDTRLRLPSNSRMRSPPDSGTFRGGVVQNRFLFGFLSVADPRGALPTPHALGEWAILYCLVLGNGMFGGVGHVAQGANLLVT